MTFGDKEVGDLIYRECNRVAEDLKNTGHTVIWWSQEEDHENGGLMFRFRVHLADGREQTGSIPLSLDEASQFPRWGIGVV